MASDAASDRDREAQGRGGRAGPSPTRCEVAFVLVCCFAGSHPSPSSGEKWPRAASRAAAPSSSTLSPSFPFYI